MLAASKAALTTHLDEAAQFRWSPMELEDADGLFNAQNVLAREHLQLTLPYFGANLEEWKAALGYPSDEKRMDFLRNMPTATTRLGKRLHCLKLTCYKDHKTVTAGFIDFEVKPEAPIMAGRKVRDIYVRGITVNPKMRALGCGKKLFDAMMAYLEEGDIDVIRLNVFDLNTVAMKWYFEIGFRVTGWYRKDIGSGDSRHSLMFLNMQKMQGDRLLDDNGLRVMHLQDMPCLFQSDVVGELVCLTLDGQNPSVAGISEYDAATNKFKIVCYPEREENGFCEGSTYDVDVNDLFSRGHLWFSRPTTVRLNADQETRPASPKAKAKRRKKSSDAGLDKHIGDVD